MKKRGKTSSGSFILRIAAVSALAGTAVFFLLLAVFAFALFALDAPYTLYRPSALAAVAVSSFTAGRTGGFLNRKKGIVSGMLYALPVIMTAVGMFFLTGEKMCISLLAVNFAVSLVFGAAGGISGVNRRVAGRMLIYKDDDGNV